MNMQARSRPSRRLPPVSLLLLASIAWWLLLRIDWAAAGSWINSFLVFYGTWMMDP